MFSSIFIHSYSFRIVSLVRVLDYAKAEKIPDCRPMKLRFSVVIVFAFSERTNFYKPKSLIFWHFVMLRELKLRIGASAKAYNVSLDAKVRLMSNTAKLTKFSERSTSPMPLSVMAKQLDICNSFSVLLERWDFLARRTRN
jgi:hypothetical protein